MNANKPFAILFIAGEGGHLEQANRLLSYLDCDVRAAAECILLTDALTQKETDFDDTIVLPTCAPKHRATGVSDVAIYLWCSMKLFWLLRRKYKIRLAVVTGPGFALVPAIESKVLGAKLVVLESWSRFEQKSNCGKTLYPFADTFLIQNQELQELYPKATWVGLL